MRVVSTLVVTAALCTVAFVSAVPARAATYYVGDISTRATARGNANIVNPHDPTALWLNPAAITNASGLQLNIDGDFVLLQSQFIRDCGGVANGCAPIDVERSYAGGRHKFKMKGNRPDDNPEQQPGPADVGELGNIDTPSRFDGKTSSSNNLAGIQPIPRLFLTFNLDTFGIDGVAVGAYVFAPNGAAYDYAPDSFTRYTMINRTLYEVFYGVGVGYRFGDWFALGGTVGAESTGLDQTLAITADKYGNENPLDDITVRIKAEKHLIPTGSFGVWSNPGKLLGIGNLEIGASMLLGRQVKVTGPVTIEDIGPGLKELIDSGTVSIKDKGATATGEFTLPPFYRAGIKYGRDDIADGFFAFDVEGDVVYEQWSTYDHVYLETKNLTADTGSGAKEFDPITQPKDWNDSMSFRFGGTAGFWQRALEVHGGGYYETAAIPNETYSVELVDGDRVGVGVGVSGKMWGVRLDVAYGHVFMFDRKIGTESIVHAADANFSLLEGGAETSTRTAMGTYTASFDMLNIGVNIGFDEMFGFGKYAAPRAVMPPETAPAAAPAPAADAPTAPAPTSPAPEATPAPETPPSPQAAPAPVPQERA